MIVTFRKPVEGLRGKIRLEDGFYIRKLHGRYVAQRCPNRKGACADGEGKGKSATVCRSLRC